MKSETFKIVEGRGRFRLVAGTHTHATVLTREEAEEMKKHYEEREQRRRGTK